MNNRYLYRAKRTDNGEWVEGSLLIAEKTYIICEAETECIDGENTDLYATEWYEVDPSTICQCTGKTDTNKSIIWEYDICEIGGEEGYFIVKWDDDKAKFILEGNGIVVDFDNYYGYECEVIGNIFDTPLLLEVEHE